MKARVNEQELFIIMRNINYTSIGYNERFYVYYNCGGMQEKFLKPHVTAL